MSMYCPRCGSQNFEADVFCRKCGLPLNQATPIPTNTLAQSPQTDVYVQQPAAERETSGFAIASLILGIFGISILAIIFGLIALVNIRRNPSSSGRGMAIAGLVLGTIDIIIEVIVILAISGAINSFST